MPYFIGEACVDVMDRSCVEECPVDCIYEGRRKLYVNPDECIDCGACLPACPTEAIGVIGRADSEFADDNATFFRTVLDGRDAPLGSPAGAAGLGPVGVDTALVARRSSEN